MALKFYQRSIELNTIYEVVILNNSGKQEQNEINIEAKGGTIDILGYNGATENPVEADMTLQSSNTGVEGIEPFDVVPRYILVKQNTGTTTEITLSGIEIVRTVGTV